MPDGAEDDVWSLSPGERRALGIAPLPGSLAEAISVMERSELVARFGHHAVLEVSGADLTGRRGQQLDRARDALRQVEPHPRGPHENHEGEHQEEREVHTGQWLLEHEQLR